MILGGSCRLRNFEARSDGPDLAGGSGTSAASRCVQLLVALANWLLF